MTETNLTSPCPQLAPPVQILPPSMTSLPMPAVWSEPLLSPEAGEAVPAHAGSNEDNEFLLRAFRSFAATAASLEDSYSQLREEVARLRVELAASNRDLGRSLEENRSMRAHLDRILEGLPCGVLVAAADGAITRINPEALRLLGCGEDGCSENACSEDQSGELASLAALPQPVSEFLISLRTQEQEQEQDQNQNPEEDRELRLEGEGRWLAARHAWIASAAGQEACSVFILRDVSERRGLEQAREKLGRERALAEMSAVLAHEVRNPLGSLELFTGLLEESELKGEGRRWLEHVRGGLRSLHATVDNVLHFHSPPEPERSPVDLGQLLAWARDFFAPLARQSGIALSLQNRVDGVLFPADRHRLQQVLMNLVLNAVRAMPGGGWIELGGRRNPGGGSVLLSIADTGPGISPEHLARIFEPGFTTRAGGPGLGLAVCRTIAAQHGGSIAAASRAGRGACFTLTLPLAAELGLREKVVEGGIAV
jgi:two-component system, sensor histidine kinase FlrB